MKDKLSMSVMLFFACMPFMLNACAEQKAAAAYFPDTAGPYKIYIASDPHIFFSDMHDDSETYKRFEAGGEGKMISYSDRIMDAFINDVLTERPNAVMITGDLTLNGEKLGHEALAALLKKITDAGIRVLVIPGNHDINSPYARIIRGGKFFRTDYVSAKQFKNIYSDFGYGDPLYRAPDSLSYITRLNNNLYAVMLDTCVYASNTARNRSVAAGTLDKKALAWLEKSVKEIKARNSEARFVTAMHHNLLRHNRFFSQNFVIRSAREAEPLFADLGLSLVFTGHIHIQHIKTSAENSAPVTEIANSSLILYPSAYGVVELDKTGGRYHTQEVNMARYALRQGLEDENLFDFAAYSKAAFTRREESMTRRNSFNYPEEDIQAAEEVMGEINSAFFAGRIDEIAGEIKQSRGYQVLSEMGMARGYMNSVFEDSAGIHNEFDFEW